MPQADLPGRVRALARLAFFCSVAGVLVLSLLPHPEVLPVQVWDKAQHAFAFLVMALCGAVAWPARLARVLCGLLAYGVLIEFLQALTPTRSADAADVVADAIGLLLAAGLVRGGQVVARRVRR